MFKETGTCLALLRLGVLVSIRIFFIFLPPVITVGSLFVGYYVGILDAVSIDRAIDEIGKESPSVIRLESWAFLLAAYLYIRRIVCITANTSERSMGVSIMRTNWRGGVVGMVSGLVLATAYSLYLFRFDLPVAMKCLSTHSRSNMCATGFHMLDPGLTLGPIVEEYFYRCYFYTVVKKRLNVFCGIIFTSVVFAGIHALALWQLFPFALLTQFLLSMVVTFLYEKCRSIFPCILGHCAYNVALSL